MRLKIGRQNDVPYRRLDEAGIIVSEEVQPGVILDLDKDNNMVGLEVLLRSTRVLQGSGA